MWQATGSFPFLCSNGTPSQVKTGLWSPNASDVRFWLIPSVRATHAGLRPKR
ncbi:uncharacterized protein METZ01_LOCUS181513 [marine metagenome]|uniref:Uncharacterized protein n=1 Tax=marine metagenome TaxID=408172 RepID=A0A382CRZ5_9ZZZZ